MIQKSKEEIEEDQALHAFCLFMVQNWDSFHGRWCAQNDLEDAIRDNDESRIVELGKEVTRLKGEAIRLEENVYLTQIAAGNAAKQWVANLVASDSGQATPEQVEQLTIQLASVFDRNLWRAEQQLENHRKKHGLSDHAK